MKLLSISPVVPSTKNAHAGGRVFYFYASKLCKEAEIDYSLLVFCKKKDSLTFDLDTKNKRFIFTSGTIISSFSHFFYDYIIGRKYSLIHYSLFKQKKVISYLKHLKRVKNLPDVIQLEWTEMVYFAPQIKKLFPSIRIIATEHDVTFLAAYRKASLNPQNKTLKKRYELVKSVELKALSCCDVIMPFNEKDKALLLENGIPNNKIFVLTPFFHSMLDVVRKPSTKDILFWGAMNRPENYEAAEWFIIHVMPLLKTEGVRFIAAGNNPPKSLVAYASDRIVVTGFINDETSLFEKSLCFVAPLLTGAGIKIKVLEALSSGIPVLTNDIGIEGINAVDGESFFFCKTPEDYANVIGLLLAGTINIEKMELSQKDFVRNGFEMEKSYSQYLSLIKRFNYEKE